MNDIDAFSFNNHHAESSRNAGGSGLKLVLPPLSALKSRKRKSSALEEPPRKIPRPIKLKPLKEVLTKLIVQIKKKDDYAFFLRPVDVSQVPGYADAIKQPMDLGTMSTKVERGRYRSLEEFANDVRLVTGNAKTFNLPGTIYHTEAERIEQYALDHIAKASASVIEYEADWNIDIERDDMDVPGEGEDGEKGGAMDVDEGSRARSPSVASTAQAQTQSRRVGKGAAAISEKKPPGALSESLEPDGGLPGTKDGLGAFPPESEWAQLMLALKLKGKRYRTKKERLRMEKAGPPYTQEGSLDYTEMEAPFSVLQAFVPEPMSRPLITPLYPAESVTAAPVNVHPSTSSPYLPSLASSSKKPSGSKKRRHWTVVRNLPSRRAREREEDDVEEPWRQPRDLIAADFGAYATLAADVAAEKGVKDFGREMGSEERLLSAIRDTVESTHVQVPPWPREGEGEDAYWRAKAHEAEEYVRDVVYGGVDGLAYVRSLAEFLTHSEPVDPSETFEALGMPLARWVEQEVVDPLTAGRHRVLCDAARHLVDARYPADPVIAAQVRLSTDVYPQAARQLFLLRELVRRQIDMAALIRDPEELFVADDEWAGKVYWLQTQKARDDALAAEAGAADFLKLAADAYRSGLAGEKEKIKDTPEMVRYAIDYTAEALAALARQVEDGFPPVKQELEVTNPETKDEGEDTTMRKIRMNLLALAKRAPLDQITRLPPELVPEQLHKILPTIIAS